MQYNILLNDWLSRRKISDSIISEFNVHWGSNPTFGECIVIPIHDEHGVFLFNKYRRNPLVDLKPKYIYDKGSKITLYCADKIQPSDKTVLVTEGEMDCLVARSANISAVSSTGGALSFQKEWKSFFEGKEVVLCFDNDGAGGEGMVRALEIIPWAKILFLPDRAGVKDISDYVTSGGDLNELMKTAIGFADMQAVVDDRSVRQATWQSTHFHDAYIKHHTDKQRAVDRVKRHKMDGDDFAVAKQYPIEDLVRFDKGKAPCVWHNEKTASMHYYSKTNSVYCFGCGKYGDAIDVYRQLHGVGFKEAIKALQ